MATLTPLLGVAAVQLGTTETTIMTAAENTLAVVLHLANVTASPVTVDIHVVPSGDTAADDTALAKGYSIPANDFAVLNCGNVEADTVISGLASAATSITASIISGVQRV